jgi:predicted MFS family arabinose efflux permease
MATRATGTSSARRSRLITPGLGLVLAVIAAGLTSVYLLLSVVPLYAASGGGGGTTAGTATGVLMLATVAGEVAMPRLSAAFGYRPLLAAGLILLGAPALALTASHDIAVILAVCAVRGFGFAIIVVAGGALVPALVPAERRGEGLGIFGIVAGVPAVAALPLGVWLVRHAGYPLVFVLGAAAALAGLAVIRGLPRGGPAPDRRDGVLAGLRSPALRRPAIAFSVTAMASGVVVTFLPLAVTRSSGNLAAAALLAQAATATLARWWAGRHGDRHGPARLLIPGILAAAAGMLALTLRTSPAAVVGGMVLFGAGFGVSQNASMAFMIGQVTERRYGTVSALWNLGYDAATGAGAAGFGLLAPNAGYAAGFAVTAAVVVAGLIPAARLPATRPRAGG